MNDPWPEMMQIVREETRLLMLMLEQIDVKANNVIAFPATKIIRFPIERTRARGEN